MAFKSPDAAFRAKLAAIVAEPRKGYYSRAALDRLHNNLQVYRDPSQPTGWLIRTYCLDCHGYVQTGDNDTWRHTFEPNNNNLDCTPNPALYQIEELDL